MRRGGHVVTGYPGLVDRGDSVDVRVFPTAAERDAAHARGVRRLLLLDTPSPARQVQRGLDSATRLVLARNPHGSVAALVDDCVTAAADALIHAAGGPAWDERGYARLKALFAKRLAGTTQQVLDAVRAVLTVWHRVQAALTDLRAVPRDLTAQLDDLVGPGFATRDGATRLADVARYLEAAERRIEKLRVDPARDAAWTAEVAVVADEYAQLRGRPPARHRAVARAARDPLDDRGAAGEPLRAPDAHALPGVGPADPAGHRRAADHRHIPALIRHVRAGHQPVIGDSPDLTVAKTRDSPC